MYIKNLNKKIEKFLNESEEKTFADWFGKDLTGQIYNGNINCGEKGLTSLKGAPQEVNGSFYCGENNLTSLKGAPQKVSGDFNCSQNKLISLEGAPQEVGGSFYCFTDYLTSLEGAPQVVGRDFNCSHNELTSLQGAPQKVGRDFKCYDNELTSLQGAPQVIGRDFDCSINNLTSLEGAPQKISRDFDCSDNKLTSLKGAPQEIGRGFKHHYNPDLNSLNGIGNEKGKILKDLKSNKPSYEWRVDELKLQGGGFKSAKAAYMDAKKYFKSEGYKVGDFDGEGCTLYDPGDSNMGFLPFDGYCEIKVEGSDED